MNIPDIDKWDRQDIYVRELLRAVGHALLDAGFYADGQLPGRDMSKVARPFVVESMRLSGELEGKQMARVIFTHKKHASPLLIDGSPEQAEMEQRGFSIAREGMRLGLQVPGANDFIR